ncbi:MAG: hypothetical protein ACRECO_02580 [Xanthobacteraceae bacterium]
MRKLTAVIAVLGLFVAASLLSATAAPTARQAPIQVTADDALTAFAAENDKKASKKKATKKKATKKKATKKSAKKKSAKKKVAKKSRKSKKTKTRRTPAKKPATQDGEKSSSLVLYRAA